MSSAFFEFILFIINAVAMLILLIEAVFFVVVMVKKYKKSKHVVNLYFSLLLLILIGAGVFLALEPFCYLFGFEDLGRIFKTVVLIPTTFAGTLINLIAFDLTFTKQKKFLII